MPRRHAPPPNAISGAASAATLFTEGNQVTLEIQAECPVTRARTGVLHTALGGVETPVFMPAGPRSMARRTLPSAIWPRIWASAFCWATPTAISDSGFAYHIPWMKTFDAGVAPEIIDIERQNGSHLVYH